MNYVKEHIKKSIKNIVREFQYSHPVQTAYELENLQRETNYTRGSESVSFIIPDMFDGCEFMYIFKELIEFYFNINEMDYDYIVRTFDRTIQICNACDSNLDCYYIILDELRQSDDHFDYLMKMIIERMMTLTGYENTDGEFETLSEFNETHVKIPKKYKNHKLMYVLSGLIETYEKLYRMKINNGSQDISENEKIRRAEEEYKVRVDYLNQKHDDKVSREAQEYKARVDYLNQKHTDKVNKAHEDYKKRLKEIDRIRSGKVNRNCKSEEDRAMKMVNEAISKSFLI